MSISPVNDADEVAATEGDSNLPLYVPDGNYNSLSDVPEVDDEHDKSSSTVDLERAGYEPVNIAVLSSLSSATSSLDYPTTTPTDPKLCSVCNENVMKYKCSRCYAPYCSIACLNTHKSQHPFPPPEPAKASPAALVVQPATTTARAGTAAAAHLTSPFEPLSTSSDLAALFNHYPRLRQNLTEIWLAMQPPAHPDKTWTPDVGLLKGREALGNAREAWGKDGEGVREYGELVLRIVDGIDADEVVRQELEKENARIVRALLEGEL